MKEAKLNTSWVQPNEAWDSAMADFVARVLDPSPKNRFLETFIPFTEEVAQIGAINSLAQTLLKLTAPGVPDIYQGNEIWDFSLVDPDNRRPVDYAQRRGMLNSLTTAELVEGRGGSGEATSEDLFDSWQDGRIKLFLTHRLLVFRRENPKLFAQGSYTPLDLTGAFAGSCIAFARAHEGHSIVVLAPRLTARLGFPPIGEAWRDTAVKLPDEFGNGCDLFTGESFAGEDSALQLSRAFRKFPFALLTTGLSS